MYDAAAKNPSAPGKSHAVLVFTAASVLLFAASLTQSAFYTAKGTETPTGQPGIGLLLIGWLAVFTDIFAWLANPVLLMTWLLMSFRKTRLAALACAVAALALALSFLRHRQVLADEAGNFSTITAYAPGYWLWLNSMATALVGSAVGISHDRAARA